MNENFALKDYVQELTNNEKNLVLNLNFLAKDQTRGGENRVVAKKIATLEQLKDMIILDQNESESYILKLEGQLRDRISEIKQLNGELAQQ